MLRQVLDQRDSRPGAGGAGEPGNGVLGARGPGAAASGGGGPGAAAASGAGAAGMVPSAAAGDGAETRTVTVSPLRELDRPRGSGRRYASLELLIDGK